MVARRPGVIDQSRLERPLLVGGVTAACILALLGGLEAGVVTSDGHGMILTCVLVLAVPIVLWRYEEAGLLLLVAAAALVEQFPVVLGPDQLTDGTSTIPLFTSLSSGAGATGLTFNPAEILLGVVIVVWLLRAALRHDIRLPRSTFARALGIMLLVVAAGFVVGIGHGGDLRESLIELRPWIYLGLSFLVASRVLRSRRALDGLLWVIVLASGVKAFQGDYLVVRTRSLVPQPEALLAHEESLFFPVFFLITLGLWLFDQPGRLRGVATTLVPFVLLADMGNHRRAAWVILGAAVVVMTAAAYVRLPERRRAIVSAGVVVFVASAIYTPLFWSDQGTLGQPARAVRSLVDPSARDQGSDQYRTLEDANLGINIHSSLPFGAGFGVPINYVVPIVDISNTDQLIAYVPHDGVLYVWMRMGFQGILAFWAMIATAIFAATRLSAAADKRLAMLGAIVSGSVVGYVILAYEDLGLFWFRVALVMGALLGAVEAAQSLEGAGIEAPVPTDRVAAGTATPAWVTDEAATTRRVRSIA